MPTPNPSESLRAFFAFHLKRYREQKGWSQPELGARVNLPSSLVGGIEVGARRPTRRLARGLDEIFGLEQFFEALHPRVIEEAGIPPGFSEFVEAESEAAIVKLYKNFAITGLFHTEEYARAILRKGRHPDKLEQSLAARMERTEILRREDPPVIVALIDASALRRSFGGPAVMRGQLEHLLSVAELPHVHVHVVPEDAEVLPEGSFTLLSSSESDAGYIEAAGGRGHLVDDHGYIAELGTLFESIRSRALNVEDSQVAILKELEDL
ncbi:MULTISPECIES: helix-turn-helix domain-containing protein [Actinomadura]|uniref:helix-turn-helix domain-containing protein n=1 Tax=Actinomadura TaxID=1988 RepID=UPI00042A7961|nr:MULTISPECIES: helix-turn-helix transcriptional regulator [Actinomadura]